MKRSLILALATILLTIPTITLTDEENSEKARRQGAWLGWKLSTELRGKSPEYKFHYLQAFFEKARIDK
jgi:hypothetical protein